MISQKNIAWAITFAAIGGILLLNRRKGSLLAKSYYEEYDMENYDDLPLGYRSNNPLNVRYNESNNWRGKVTPPAQGKYGLYERFCDMAYGYRTAFFLLRKRIKEGNNTIRKIITKWAPDSDHNYTDKYVSDVSRMIGIDPDVEISRNDKDTLCAMARAMSIIENGTTDKAGRNLASSYGLPNMNAIYEGWRLL